MADQPNQTEYQGPGKWTGLFGRGFMESVVGGLIGSAVGFVIALATKKPPHLETARHNEQIAHTLSTTHMLGSIGSLVGWIHGGVKGYGQGKRGERQFTVNRHKIDRLENEIKTRDGFIGKLTEERQKAPSQEISR